jgi:hypothetical protein
MKTSNTKLRNLWVAVILLLALNLSIIGTIVYTHCMAEHGMESIYIEPNAQALSCNYFCEHLGFDAQQREKSLVINSLFRRTSNSIIGNIHEQKEALFVELQDLEPNAEKIKNISMEIGLLHTRLKEATAAYYLSLNDICDAPQREKLKTIFAPLFMERSTPIACSQTKRK